MAVDAKFTRALQALVGAKQVLTEEKALRAFSRDQYDFSPILSRLLADRLAEVVVIPERFEQVVEVVALCLEAGVPLTLRGAGSGNYGQAVPLKGGVVLSTHRLSRILEWNLEEAWVRLEPGVRLGVVEREACLRGLELRIYPSTWATASVAGFLAGGFAGVGSIRYGTLWDGLLLDAVLLPMKKPVEAVNIQGSSTFQVLHAYGTTGVLGPLRLRLAPAQPWEENGFAFESLDGAVAFALEVAQRIPELRELGVFEWPIPQFFTPLVAAGGVPAERTLVLLEATIAVKAQLEAIAQRYQGVRCWYRPHEQYHQTGFALSDFTWNHTTLWARKADPRFTYTQARFQLTRLTEQIAQVKKIFGDEVFLHLEFIREQLEQGGALAVASPVLVRFSTPERLQEIQQGFEALGLQISDPHTYYLDADTRWAGTPVLEGIRLYNPFGLLNPGKLRCLETGSEARAGQWFDTVMGERSG